MDSLEEQGLTGLSYFYAGYRCFFLRRTSDHRTRRHAGPAARHGGFLADAADHPAVGGAVAVTLPPDEFALALRTHRIDGAESTLPTYVDSGYYRLAPYWTYDRHSYNADVLVASRRHGRKFSPE